MDYGAAVNYPFRGDDASVTVLVGGGVLLASFLLSFVAPLNLPLQLLFLGYAVLVVQSTLEGGTEPPAFDDLGRLLTNGLVAFGIQLAYGLLLGAALFVLIAVFMLVVVLGIGVGAGADAGGVAATVTAVGTFGVTAVFGVVVLGGSLAMGYLVPLSVCIYADTGDVAEAFSPARLRRVGTDARYAVPWAVVAGASLVVGVLVLPLYLLLVGFFVQFAFTVAAARIVALGYAAAEGIETGAGAAAATEGDTGRTAPAEGTTVREDW